MRRLKNLFRKKTNNFSRGQVGILLKYKKRADIPEELSSDMPALLRCNPFGSYPMSVMCRYCLIGSCLKGCVFLRIQQKARKPTFSGFSCTNIVFCELGSALAELRSATGGFETVLMRAQCSKTVDLQGFSHTTGNVVPPVVPYLSKDTFRYAF